MGRSGWRVSHLRLDAEMVLGKSSWALFVGSWHDGELQLLEVISGFGKFYNRKKKRNQEEMQMDKDIEEFMKLLQERSDLISQRRKLKARLKEVEGEIELKMKILNEKSSSYKKT